MKQALKFAVIFETSKTGYGVYVPDLPGCISVGDTLEEAEQNIREAITAHLEVMQEFGDVIPEPSSSAQEVLVEI